MHYKHVIGKDIIKFHAIYWPNFLKSLGHDPDLELIIHNHWIKDNVIKNINNLREKCRNLWTMWLILWIY